MNTEFWRDRDWLSGQYCTAGKSIAQISREYHVDERTVTKWLRRHGIHVQTPLERHGKYGPQFWKKRDWMIDQYITKAKSAKELSREFGLDPKTLAYWLTRHGIPIRSPSAALALLNTNSFEMTPILRDFLWGELLGDMHIHAHSRYSAAIMYTSKHRSYLEWLSRWLNAFGIEPSGGIMEMAHSSGDPRYPTVHIGYTYRSKCYHGLLTVRKEFYPGDGPKVVPRTLHMSPLVLRQWYIGDGYLETTCKSIRLCTDCFTLPDVEYLSAGLTTVGLRNTITKVIRKHTSYRIRISSSSVVDFIDYIGPCPPEIEICYGYKWRMR